MKKNKKIIALFALGLLLVSGLSGCGNAGSEDISANDATVVQATEEVLNEQSSSDALFDVTSLEMVQLMGNGINLGNTMEAYGHTTLGTNAETSSYETYWGQPVTTPEMIQAMKDCGFDSIRIPVAWTNMMDYESGDYTINAAYLDRVEEIVNYALDADMYVMFNDHWDGGWWGMFGSATEETRTKAMDLYVSMWTQIAERFKDYPSTVIFESANEELGNRLNDADVAADSGSLSKDECYEMTNLINQTFVDTIRSTGGNNANRFLLIAGYNTDIAMTLDDRFQMPTDSAKDKLILSVHYYTPWTYCGTDGVSSWGTEKNFNEMNELLQGLTKFTDMGYGIIIGEYGVLPTSSNELKDNIIEYTTNFLDNCDLYGYVPMLWDCSSFFVRNDLAIRDQALADLYLSRSYAAQSSLSLEEIQTYASASMATNLEAAIAYDAANEPETPQLNGDENAIAWIMYSSNDWASTYSVGDVYDPTAISDGIVASDIQIEEAGTYTVSLDFTGTAAGFANSCSFSALGISNGELLFPGYTITIKEILINGEPYAMTGIPYTTADDQICTRVNIYNGWVTEIPEEARMANMNQLMAASAAVIDPSTLGNVETISITFDYQPGQ